MRAADVARQRRSTLPLAAVAALVAIGASPAPASAQDFGTAARVNGAEISNERLTRFFDEYLGERGRNTAAIRSPSAFKELKRQALDVLIDQEVLWQEARRRKLVAPDREVRQAIQRFRDQFPDERRRQLALERGGFTDATYQAWVKQQLSIARYVEKVIAPRVKVGDAEVREYYEANPAQFAQPEEVRVRQIVARVAPEGGEAARVSARGRLEPLLEAARGGADFAALARQHSEDASAPSGGDLGWFSRGHTSPAFEEVAFALKPGEVSPIVETDGGLAILRVEERREAGQVPLAEVRQAIRARLLEERRRQAVQERAQELRLTGKVEVLLPL